MYFISPNFHNNIIFKSIWSNIYISTINTLVLHLYLLMLSTSTMSSLYWNTYTSDDMSDLSWSCSWNQTSRGHQSAGNTIALTILVNGVFYNNCVALLNLLLGVVVKSDLFLPYIFFPLVLNIPIIRFLVHISVS